MAQAILPILSARALLDTSVFAPAFFMLAMHWAQCIPCRARISLDNTDEDNQDLEYIGTFHTCHGGIQKSMIDNFDLTCNLFNVAPTMAMKDFITQIITNNSY
jgi:hypothetical protein